jgi:hypothetical protein
MALSEDIASKLPQSARRIISASLEEIGPTLYVDPKRADRIRKRVEKVITNLVDETKAGKSGVITYNAISGGLMRASEDDTDPDRKVASTLHGIAQTIALLTGQKEGSLNEPRALKPRRRKKNN